MRDLIVLSACGHGKATVRGILTRTPSLRIKSISVDYLVHTGKDSGCFLGAGDLLRSQQSLYRYAIVLFDRDGCGRESWSVQRIAADVQRRLDQCGWQGRSVVIVVNPELESWVWTDSIQVDAVLGWRNNIPPLREWLESEGFIDPGVGYPARPKEAMVAALRKSGKQHSSSLLEELAKSQRTKPSADEMSPGNE